MNTAISANTKHSSVLEFFIIVGCVAKSVFRHGTRILLFQVLMNNLQCYENQGKHSFIVKAINFTFVLAMRGKYRKAIPPTHAICNLVSADIKILHHIK